MKLANELRPGNILMRANNWIQLDGAAIRDIEIVPGEAALYDRIPLTAAILERCGFRDGKIRVSNDVGWAFMLEVDEGEMVLAVKEYALPLQCKYLHQLQNLFYALTAEELLVTVLKP